MKEGQARQTIKLRLLTLVLVLALIWYTMNPAPGSVHRVQRDEGPPDEERRGAKWPPMIDHNFDGAAALVIESAVDPAVEDIDALEWPEIIESA
jgi:hypothetical protein